MATILPNQIPPESIQWVKPDGTLVHTAWLFIYNIAQSVLGNSNSTAAAQAAQINADLDADVDSTDSLLLVNRVSNLEKQVYDALPERMDGNALLLAQDAILPDPLPRAQPVQVLTPGASPWTYTALADGVIIVNGGSVSSVAVSRDGTNFYTTSVGSIPVSRLDQVKLTYTGSPSATFFPR